MPTRQPATEREVAQSDDENTRTFRKIVNWSSIARFGSRFTVLGFLSFINNHPENVVLGLFSEAAYSIIGSSISIMVGATFLTAAVRFLETDVWQQYTKVGDIQDSEVAGASPNGLSTNGPEAE